MALYFDSNATTMVPPEVVKAVAAWMNRGNPSANSAEGRECQKLIASLRRRVIRLCDLGDEFDLVLTSGASESNAQIVRTSAEAYIRRTRRLPHVVTSAIEHKSLLECCRQLERDGRIELSIVLPSQTPEQFGQVLPSAVEAAIQPNTCLVTVMAANNETGVCNDIGGIGHVVARRAPQAAFHTDAVQYFAKGGFRPNELKVDAFSVSFHKLHAPPGLGLLAIRRAFRIEYGLGAMIHGTQNGGMRGGTEPIHTIAGAERALALLTHDHAARVEQIRRYRDRIAEALAKHHRTAYVTDAYPALLAEWAQSRRPTIVWISPRPADPEAIISPLVNVSTLLFSVVSRGFCNQRAKAALEKAGARVSIGSACNAAEAARGNASHVLMALGVPGAVTAGVLRVSLGYDVTAKLTQQFIKVLLAAIG